MNIISVQNGNNQTEAVENARKQLIKLNFIFTNNVVYKIMKIVDEETLFNIKNKARNFQKDIFFRVHFLTEINDKLLNNDKSNVYPNGQLKLFTEIANNEQQEKISQLKKIFKKIYCELIVVFKSYENFISKNIKLADKIQKKGKKQQYRQEQQNKKSISIVDNFKDLNDASLLLYIKQYERLVNNFKIAEQKAKNMSFSNGEHELIVNLAAMDMETTYEIAEEKLTIFDKLYQDVFEDDIKEFKKSVIELSKKINKFNNKINMIEKTR